MSAKTDHERDLSGRVAKLPTPAQAALLKILARSATRQMESALALLEDLGMAGVPASEGEDEPDRLPPHDLMMPHDVRYIDDGVRGCPPNCPARLAVAEREAIAATPAAWWARDAADWQHGPAEEEHAAGVTPLKPRSDEASDRPALIPCPPATGGERTCGDWCGNFCCTGSAIHAGLAHASHAENGSVIGVWPAAPDLPMGHLASLAGKLAQRATPGAGGRR